MIVIFKEGIGCVPCDSVVVVALILVHKYPYVSQDILMFLLEEENTDLIILSCCYLACPFFF